jgi:hypothetical protein
MTSLPDKAGSAWRVELPMIPARTAISTSHAERVGESGKIIVFLLYFIDIIWIWIILVTFYAAVWYIA